MTQRFDRSGVLAAGDIAAAMKQPDPKTLSPSPVAYRSRSDDVTRRGFVVAVLAALASTAGPVPASAGSGRRRVVGAAMRSLLKRDAARDAATAAKPLSKPKRVWRYTTQKDAAAARKQGLAADRHMTSGVAPGRPPDAGTAQRRYGLPAKPETRLTIEIPAGHPVRRNKVLGGAPGYGEITSPKVLPPGAIKDATPLR